jgi:hypothetical protein
MDNEHRPLPFPTPEIDIVKYKSVFHICISYQDLAVPPAAHSDIVPRKDWIALSTSVLRGAGAGRSLRAISGRCLRGGLTIYD